MSILSIAHLICERAASQPDLDVLTFEHEGNDETRTYSQLWEAGQQLARGLLDHGVQTGDRIGLLLQNHPEFVELMVASAIVGSVLVPLDPRMRGEKLAYMLRDAACVGVVAGDYALPALNGVTAALPALQWIATVGEDVAPGSAVPAVPLNQFRTDGDELPIAISSVTQPMQIMYTSGTTGDPKGIIVTHARFVAAFGYGEVMFGYRQGDRPYTGLSLTHGNAQYVTLAPSLAMGLRAVFSRRFTKSRLWDVIRRHGCTAFSLLGGMATAIYAEPHDDNDADNPVRHVVSAGMPAAIWEDFRSRYGLEIIEFYGAMEGGLLLNQIQAGPPGSCGKAPAGLAVRIVDEEGNDVPDGTPGELLFGNADGSPMRVEYVGNPEASAKKTEGGWLRTGDVVMRDADGWIFYQYRSGGGIRHNGDFLNPALIEKTVAECPEVADVFVWGVPAQSGAPGEKDVVATVVSATPHFDPQHVFTWCRGHLEASMVPSYVQHVDVIPKTASEKPQERFLHDAFEQNPETFHTERRHQAA
jgi:crotonobetaine/carnitine-CoA ligase